MQQRIVAPILLMLTALLWSLGGVLIKSIDLQPMAIAAGRSAIAIPVLLACGGRQRFTFSPAQIGGAIEGEPRQVVSKVATVSFLERDLGRVSSAVREERIAQIVSEEAAKPFDLSRGPLWRVLLLRVSPEEIRGRTPANAPVMSPGPSEVPKN